MVAVAWWQGLLDGLGWFLSHLYDLIPNYGMAIILLTLAIRVLLLPLGLKQIRSMQAMQALQPQIKALQQKYKGNKQKLNEEMMKLYKERGVNPLAGCLPMLLQLPVLIALYSVLRFPQHPPHLPEGSELRTKIEHQLSTGQGGGTDFVWTNLLCSAQQAGTQVKVTDKGATPGEPRQIKLDCGSGIPIRIPYYAFALLMVATTYYQQRQMQKASPAGAQQQQQALTRIMPILFGVWGFLFPAGLVVYWTTSNLIQIGQQHFLIRAKPKEAAQAAGRADGKKAGPSPTPPRRGFFASMLERAEAERGRRQTTTGGGSTAQRPQAPKREASSRPQGVAPKSSGAKSARDRKKRRKR